MNRTAAAGLSALALVAAAGLLTAGPLSPPGGSIAGTYKTLSEVEPRIAISAASAPGDADSMFKITTPGSYYLTGLLLVGPGKMGIEVATDDVTIDLNGYRIGGIAGTLAGVRLTGASRRNIVVRNGIIENLQGDGLDFLGAADPGMSTNCSAERLTIADCTGIGISLGNGTVVESCTVHNCNGGILAAALGSGNACALRACGVTGSGTYGGIGVGDHSIVESCVAEAGGSFGIFTGENCTVHGCTSHQNTLAGIDVRKSLVIDCIATANGTNGILARESSLLRGNIANSNGFGSASGAGIAIGLSGTRIEGNNLEGNSAGIRVLGDGNIIVGNTVRGGTPAYSFVAGNRFGPILNITAAGTPAVSGASATGTMTSSDPLANFAY